MAPRRQNTTTQSASRRAALSERSIDGRTHLTCVHGDAPAVRGELRALTAAAFEAGHLVVIVDLSDVGEVDSSLAWELTRAHERMLWRGAEVIAVSDPPPLERLFEAFALHRSPDVVPTLADALVAARVTRPGTGTGRGTETELAPACSDGSPCAVAAGAGPSSGDPAPRIGSRGADGIPRNGTPAAPPPFVWHRHELPPESWTFQVAGGLDAPAIARAAVGRVLQGLLDPVAHQDAVLLVSEAVTNSVRHGLAGENGPVDVAVRVGRDVVRMEVTDPAGGFDPPPYPDDPRRITGHGLPLIHALARTWGVDGPPAGRVWFEIARGADRLRAG